MTWRERLAPVIAEHMRETADLPEPERTRERHRRRRDEYPCGERKHWPYKVWLDEWARQTGRKRRRPIRPKLQPSPGQMSLFE